ncbi:MAG: ADP-ribosylation factor-like protein 2 [Cercozoa sp. M6MM]
MGLHSILREVKRKEKQMRVLILGLDNAGKTTAVKKICGEDIESIEPTLGFNIKTIQHGERQLNVWDVGGQQTIRSYWRNYFEQTDGIIWVVDSADRRRLDQCKQALDDLLQEERLVGATLLVLCNKQDLAGALSAAQITQVLQLDEQDRRHVRVQECSAVTGAGLSEALDWFVDDIASRLFFFADDDD